MGILFFFSKKYQIIYTLVNCFAYVKLTQINKNLTNALIPLLKVCDSRLPYFDWLRLSRSRGDHCGCSCIIVEEYRKKCINMKIAQMSTPMPYKFRKLVYWFCTKTYDLIIAIKLREGEENMLFVTLVPKVS